MIISLRCQLISALSLIATGCASSPPSPSANLAAESRFSHQMHNRFYDAWVQPDKVGLPRGKVSVPVDVRIDRAGCVVDFKIVRSSGNARIDTSIADVGGRIRKVTAPPLRSAQKLFTLRIFFELDVK